MTVVEMDSQQRHALKSLRLGFAPVADEMFHSQGNLHVGGINEEALGDALSALDDARSATTTSPLGVVIQGQAGSGKTHLLGQVRERVQQSGGYFYLVQLLDAAGFWRSVLGGMLESLGRPGKTRETQLKDILWELFSLPDIERPDRRKLIDDGDITPETLDNFVKVLHKEHKTTVRRCHHTLRALVLLSTNDLELQDIGEAYLTGTDDLDADHRRVWGLGTPPKSEQECVSQISHLVALAGPAVLAIDQIDALVAQYIKLSSSPDATHNQDLDVMASGMMNLREITRRTTTIVACLPTVWQTIQDNTIAAVPDRFRSTSVLKPISDPAVGRAILERRFSASYSAIEFDPPYPSWPIRPDAFASATDLTPREVLQLADRHVRRCLSQNHIDELTNLRDAAEVHNGAKGGDPVDLPRTRTTLKQLDKKFADYRQRAVPTAALDPESEDTTLPELLAASLQAWIIEHGESNFERDPLPGRVVSLHGRLRQKLDPVTEDEEHWAFRAIATTNAVSAQSKIKKACGAAGFSSTSRQRNLFLLRNSPWPGGKRMAELLTEFESAGGRVLPLSDDGIRTAAALREMFQDNHDDLSEWLRTRRHAHQIAFLASVLGEFTKVSPPALDDVSDDLPAIEDPPAEDEQHEESTPTEDPTRPDSPTAIPLGLTVDEGDQLSVDLAALRKHTAIFAGSGSGKTVLIRRLIEECALRGVSSIVLDPNNDLSRLGSPWPEKPSGWLEADDARAADYLENTEVLVWTPRRSGGRPLSFQPLPDFASVLDDDDEFSDAVESAVAALEPRALISGNTAKANRSRAVLRQALQSYGRQRGTSVTAFVGMLADLPDEVSAISGARDLAAELAQNLRAAMVNDPLFGGSGTPADPSALLTPSKGFRARVSVISMVGLTNDQQRQGFVNQLQMALFAWIKRKPAGDRPLGGLFVMDEAQNFAPSGRSTPCTQSTLALASQARKYGLGLVFATQNPRGLDNNIPGNATTQFFGLLSSPNQITVAKEVARAKGGLIPDISRLSAGYFYAALEGKAFQKIRSPWCLSHHPASPPTTEEVVELARQNL